MRGKSANCALLFALMFVALTSAQPAFAGDITINFDGLPGSDGSPFNNYTEFGFEVSAVTDQWLVGQSGGNPGLYIYFVAQANQVITATIDVTDGGAEFNFKSVDLYSSITPIPYTFTGMMGNNQVFSVSGTVPNTFGNFATVDNPDDSTPITSLEISLTNDPGSCCSNPMGVDNIVVSQGATTTPEPGTLLLLASGAIAVAFRLRREES